MTDLLLQPVPAGGSNEYEIIADGRVIGRITLISAASKASMPWVWSIDLAFHDDRDPVLGFEATRGAAMQAFARSWHRENQS